MTHVNLMWRAIEGGLGEEKTAYLRERPLNEIIRDKVAHEHGVSLGSNMTLGDAVGAVAISWRKKKAQHNRIRSGLKSLSAALPQEGTKTAAEESATAKLYPADTSTFHKIAAARKLRILSTVAQGDAVEKLAHLRAAVDRDVLDSLKKEAVLSGIAKHPVARNLGKGMAVGAGAAVPLGIGGYAAGSALSDKFTDDARDKALQTAAGVGALTVGTYGLSKAIGNKVDGAGVHGKQASAQSSLHDFQTTVYIDALLDSVPETAKIASVREMNCERAVTMLCDALMSGPSTR